MGRFEFLKEEVMVAKAQTSVWAAMSTEPGCRSRTDRRAVSTRFPTEKRSVRACWRLSSGLQQTRGVLLDRSTGKAIKVRRAKDADSSAVASLCAEVFGPLTFYGFPGILQPSKTLSQQANKEIQQDVRAQLLKSLSAKQTAQQQAREYRLLQLNAMMRAELDRLAGRPSYFSSTPTLVQRHALDRWKRSRQFACILATHDDHPDVAVGCAVVSLATPEALLPPPWPSSAPLRCCVSNVAVAEQFRRQGVARAILQSCELLARRWGYQDIWLHAETHNDPAAQLYSSLDYEEVRRDPGFFGPFQRILLCKQLESRRIGCHQPERVSVEMQDGKYRDGVYVWDVTQKPD